MKPKKPSVTFKLGRLLLALAIGATPLVFADEVNPSQPELLAKISLSGDRSIDLKSADSAFGLTQLGASEVASIGLTFTTDLAGQTITFESPDGGTLTPKTGETATIDQNGGVTFSFQTGTSPGKYQVMVKKGDQQWALLFWVPDLQRPADNPETLTAE